MRYNLFFIIFLLTSGVHAAVVGFDFSNQDLVPEILDTNVSIQNANAVGGTFASPDTRTVLWIDNTAQPHTFAFEVVVDSGFEFDLTGFEITGAEHKLTGITGSLWIDQGSGFTEITETQHVLSDRDLGGFPPIDFSVNTLASYTGLTGTIGFQYRAQGTGNGDDVQFDSISLLGSTAVIPEPSSLALLGVAALGILAFCRRRK